MGSRYLLDLADVLRAAGLNVKEVKGWHFRSRSTGGYDGGPTHLMWHHTASGPSSDGERDVNYMCFNAPYRPITNFYIQRDGTVWVCAGGATNTEGRGSDTWGGGTPTNAMNPRALSCEIANNGIGEVYPPQQQNSIIVAAVALSKAYDIDPDRNRSHQEWAPSRKVDPRGPAHWSYGRNEIWDMDFFRSDLFSRMVDTPDTDVPAFNPEAGEYSLWPLNENKPTIRLGSKGDAVSYLQGVMHNTGGETVAVNGDFDFATDKRVKEFQVFFGLTVDGICGPITWSVMDQLATQDSTPPKPEPTPEPTPEPVKSYQKVSTGSYYVRSGDSPWAAATRIYGTGTKYGKLTPTDPPSPGFSQPNHYIGTPGVGGKTTEVLPGEGPYSILKRIEEPAGKLQKFYDFNGGKFRVLQPGDFVFVPD